MVQSERSAAQLVAGTNNDEGPPAARRLAQVMGATGGRHDRVGYRIQGTCCVGGLR